MPPPLQPGSAHDALLAPEGPQHVWERLERRLVDLEGQQRAVRREAAELAGGLRSLEGELQAQVRRWDVAEERLAAWRRRAEEDLRGRCTALEQGLRRDLAGRGAATAALEDAHRRQQQRLERLEDALQGLEYQLELPRANRVGLLDVSCRVEALEARLGPSQKGRLPSKPSSRDVGLICARLQHQDEELKSLRALSEVREAQIRKLEDSFRDASWEQKLEQLTEAVRREAGERAKHLERFEHVALRVERQEEGQELLRSVQEQLWWHSPEVIFSPRAGVEGARAEEPKPTSMHTPSTSRAPSPGTEDKDDDAECLRDGNPCSS